MNARKTSRSKALLAVALLMVVGSANMAAGEINSEVIAAYNRLSGKYAVMSANNGSGFTERGCGGDLTHQGAPRYFLRTVSGTIVLPDGYLNSFLAAADEDCSLQVTLSGQPSNMRFSTSRWSPDGSQIAAYARTFDLDSGLETAAGIYIADVVRDETGRPVGIENLRLEISRPEREGFSWSGDNTRIAFEGAAPDGQGGQQSDLFVHHVGTPISDNITQTADTNEFQPSWSPVDERIAFVQLVTVRGNYRYDIFVISSGGGPVTQVTRKGTTGQPQNIHPCFSPDGQFLSFSSGDPWYKNDIYRIKADGSGKAANLTAKRNGDFRSPFWRR